MSGGGRPEPWTPEMVERLRALAADKALTATDISITLTDAFDRLVSRNAVLGQARRNGIAIGKPRARPSDARRTAAQERVQRLSAAPRRQRPKPPPTKVMAPPPAGHVAGDPWPDDGVHWPGREAPPHGRQCHWPIGNPSDPGFGFCGRHVAARTGEGGMLARSYCRSHRVRALARPARAGSDDDAPETAA